MNFPSVKKISEIPDCDPKLVRRILEFYEVLPKRVTLWDLEDEQDHFAAFSGDEDMDRVWSAMESYVRQLSGRPEDYMVILHGVDAALRTCGVESARLARNNDDLSAPYVAYCNTGHMWALTVLWRTDKQRFSVSCLGTHASRV